MHIQLSSTRYTRGSFVAQAGALASSHPPPRSSRSPRSPPRSARSPRRSAWPAACARWGWAAVDAVTADLGFYDGTPAAVIVTVTGATRTAYAVRRSCSADGAAVLHPGVPVS